MHMWKLLEFLNIFKSISLVLIFCFIPFASHGKIVYASMEKSAFTLEGETVKGAPKKELKDAMIRMWHIQNY